MPSRSTRAFVGAYVNLADAWRQLGREPEAEKVLRQGLAVLPRDADLHHALGLLLTRKGDKAAALNEFVEAARLAPDNARYAYVHAIAVNSAGKRERGAGPAAQRQQATPQRSRHPERATVDKP